MKRTHQLGLGLMSLFMVMACQAPEDKRPDNLIEPNRMAAILTEVHMVENRVSRLGLSSIDSSNMAYKHLEKQVFQKFKVDTTTYTKSYIYYSSHPREMEAIYTKVVENLKKKIDVKKNTHS